MSSRSTFVKPFAIEIADGALADLNRRVRATKWPPVVDGADWFEGTSQSYLRELVKYWAEDFNWRAQERELNSLPQYRWRRNGADIHFFHFRSKRPDAIPLLICHGWPGGNLEFVKIAGALANPTSTAETAFHVVAPAMPGYGFSDAPRTPGTNIQSIAGLWARLMSDLGYEKFGVQGGDWGAWVALRLSADYPARVLACHLNYLPARYLPAPGDGGQDFTEQEADYLAARRRWMDEEFGYGHIQGTKPQTLAFGLSDSPSGLAAWILEKFYGWSDCGGDIETVFSKETLLTNISIYWFTNTIYSSIRLYREAALELRSPDSLLKSTATPIGVAIFPKDFGYPPKSHIERFLNIVRWTEMPAGGHFAALEKPELLAEDIRAFFGAIATELSA
jgi:pimeloyl-ACP methyl ester carboxylesterase